MITALGFSCIVVVSFVLAPRRARAQCPPGYEDCDGDPANGCEHALLDVAPGYSDPPTLNWVGYTGEEDDYDFSDPGGSLQDVFNKWHVFIYKWFHGGPRRVFMDADPLNPSDRFLHIYLRTDVADDQEGVYFLHGFGFDSQSFKATLKFREGDDASHYRQVILGVSTMSDQGPNRTIAVLIATYQVHAAIWDIKDDRVPDAASEIGTIFLNPNNIIPPHGTPITMTLTYNELIPSIDVEVSSDDETWYGHDSFNLAHNEKIGDRFHFFFAARTGHSITIPTPHIADLKIDSFETTTITGGKLLYTGQGYIASNMPMALGATPYDDMFDFVGLSGCYFAIPPPAGSHGEWGENFFSPLVFIGDGKFLEITGDRNINGVLFRTSHDTPTGSVTNFHTVLSQRERAGEMMPVIPFGKLFGIQAGIAGIDRYQKTLLTNHGQGSDYTWTPPADDCPPTGAHDFAIDVARSGVYPDNSCDGVVTYCNLGGDSGPADITIKLPRLLDYAGGPAACSCEPPACDYCADTGSRLLTCPVDPLGAGECGRLEMKWRLVNPEICPGFCENPELLVDFPVDASIDPAGDANPKNNNYLLDFKLPFPLPTEVCDGLDNDCDDLTDEEPEASDSCDDGNVCTADSCVKGACQYTPVDGAACDDGNTCTTAETCSGGVCIGTNEPDGTPCDDGSACTVDDVCSQGICNGGATLDCDDGNPCTDDGCDPVNGCNYTANNAPCDDGNACTAGDNCSAAGVCLGEPSAATYFYDGSSRPESYPGGAWAIYSADPGVVWYSDGASLHIDTYESGGSLEFYRQEPALEDAPGYSMSVDTHITRYRPGAMFFSYLAFGVNDGGKGFLAWTGGDPTEGNIFIPVAGGGAYSATGVDWFSPADYQAVVNRDSPNPAERTLKIFRGGELLLTVPYDELEDSPPELPPYIFGVGGYYSDSVWAYIGYGVMGKVCDDGDPCTEDSCDPISGCDHLAEPDGTPCDDGNACTLTDTCQAGSCTGSNPVTCTAIDECHSEGTCDPATGLCSNPTMPDGTPCDDGNACTLTDTCQAGSCTGSNPVTCTAIDDCHMTGTCDPATGLCSNPVMPDGTSCDDGNACTLTDTCQAGSCTGSNPVTCTAIDDCHTAGTCDPATGLCSNPVMPDGTPCNDGDWCTMNDICTNGICDGVPKDSDGDGDPDELCGGRDCDENDPTVYWEAPELCDGKDNDCDGKIDEDLGFTTCGMGVCQHTVPNCFDGQEQVCDPFEGASPEICNGEDDDCDGYTDEGPHWGSMVRYWSCTATSALGECRHGSYETCQAGEWVCQPAQPQNEWDFGCDGLDNDCDGETDEHDPMCEPPECFPSQEVCNGEDDDCNGQVDEGDLPDVGENCTGAYASLWPGVPHSYLCDAGTWRCFNGHLDCLMLGSGKPEACNGIDDNCDGDVDEWCIIQEPASAGYSWGSSWSQSDCAFLTEPAELSACFGCPEPLPPYPGTGTCTENLAGCLGGFNDEQGVALGPFPVPAEYPEGTYMLAYNLGAGDETAYIYKITITAREDWASQFPLAFDFIAYESDDLVTNPDFEQGVLLSQARVERRLVDVPVPAGGSMTFYFVPQLETRNLAIAIHGLRWWQDPDLSDGDQSGCFTAIESVTFEGGLLADHTSMFDSDGDGLSDDFEISAGMDPNSAAVCELEGLVCRCGIENHGIENSLEKKAENACRKHRQGNDNAAANILNAFMNEVEAQCGVHITQAVADMLTSYAQAAWRSLQ